MRVMERERLSDLTLAHESNSAARAFLEWAVCRSLGGDGPSSLAMYRARAGDRHLAAVEKAAITPSATTDVGSLSPLRLQANAFLAAVNQRSALGRMIGFRRTAPHVTVPRVTTGSVIDFVPESGPIPIGALATDLVTLPASRLGLILAISRELARRADALPLIQHDVLTATAIGTDRAAFDPTRGGSMTVPPALTFGATNITATPDVEGDLAAMLASVSGGAPARPYWALGPTAARFLATLRTPSGTRVFPDLGITGGTLWGIEVLVSSGVGARVVLADAAAIVLADEGIALDSSDVAALRLDTDPASGATMETSLFQSDLTALKIERYLAWARAADAISYREVV